MKDGNKFYVNLKDLAEPLVGRIVTITLPGEEPVRCRVLSVHAVTGCEVVSVPDGVKE